MRRAVSISAVLVLLAAASYADANNAGQRDAPPGFAFRQDIVYGPQSERQRLDLLHATDSGAPLPVIVHIHGGGWYTGDKGGDKTFQLMRALSEAGYAVASIAYRLSDDAPFPAAIEDCKLVVRFLRAHAAEYRVDADRIGAIGASAGGHLAAMLAVTTLKDELEGTGGYDDQSSAIQAAVVVCGPTNLTVPLSTKLKDKDDPLVVRFLGGSLAEKQDEARRASPIFYVNKTTPPMFFMHSMEDKRVDPSQSTSMAEAMAKAGARFRIALIADGVHGMAGRLWRVY